MHSSADTELRAQFSSRSFRILHRIGTWLERLKRRTQLGIKAGQIHRSILSELRREDHDLQTPDYDAKVPTDWKASTALAPSAAGASLRASN
jgi:hypothetical protein